MGRIVRDPNQPREEFDEESLDRLAQSMKTSGQLQPVRVRWDEGQGAYVMIAGERRWLAAQLAGLPTVAAVIHEGELSRGQLLAIQLVENCLRDDLRPIEQAQRLPRISWTRTGGRPGSSPRSCPSHRRPSSQAVALLKLPEPLQEQVEQGVLAPATAYEVSKIEDPAGAGGRGRAGGRRRAAPRRRRRRYRARRGETSSTASRSVRGNCKITVTVTGPASEAEAWADEDSPAQEVGPCGSPP